MHTQQQVLKEVTSLYNEENLQWLLHDDTVFNNNFGITQVIHSVCSHKSLYYSWKVFFIYLPM